MRSNFPEVDFLLQKAQKAEEKVEYYMEALKLIMQIGNSKELTEKLVLIFRELAVLSF